MTDPNTRRRNEKLDLTGRPCAVRDPTVAAATAAEEKFRSLRDSAPRGSCRTSTDPLGCRVQRARSGSKSKPPPRVVRGRPQGPVGKPAEAVDETATGSLNLLGARLAGRLSFSERSWRQVAAQLPSAVRVDREPVVGDLNRTRGQPWWKSRNASSRSARNSGGSWSTVIVPATRIVASICSR
jgi:hypothetical protein